MGAGQSTIGSSDGEGGGSGGQTKVTIEEAASTFCTNKELLQATHSQFLDTLGNFERSIQAHLRDDPTTTEEGVPALQVGRELTSSVQELFGLYNGTVVDSTWLCENYTQWLHRKNITEQDCTCLLGQIESREIEWASIKGKIRSVTENWEQAQTIINDTIAAHEGHGDMDACWGAVQAAGPLTVDILQNSVDNMDVVLAYCREELKERKQELEAPEEWEEEEEKGEERKE